MRPEFVRRGFIRRASIAVALTLGLAWLGVPAPAGAQTVLDDPGTVVASSPMPSDGLPQGVATGTYVTYWTTGPQDRPAPSTGAVLLPPGEPPAGGWPVISWGHGAVGVADKCAPTVTGQIVIPYLESFLQQGYAIVATDYVGLGTPGIHPYLDGPSEGHSVIDMVRAGRAVTPSLSDRWVALGHSQGGHAVLAAASIATRYAPELDFRGTVATGAPSNIEKLAPLTGPSFPALPLTGSTVFIAYALAGLRAANPDLDVDSYLSPLGRDVLGQIESLCYADAQAQFSDLSIGQLLSRPLDGPEMQAALERSLAVPVTGYDRPLFIGHGIFDEMVPVVFTYALTSELVAAGQNFVFHTYPATHVATMYAALPDVTEFVRSALR
ncbi:lipase [Rhodococcus sp. WMMA185]|uniref:lipase family protein n=1 Tax=Rhodococcus sp. WMMA185 TaxID=679318 RepID=UPI0008784AC8|nr:lipase family protein [Rhodococcus sp. WMMA185]AOW92814.1 lipase [Rhodococcus sp. WMMA185]